jgi:hypothetical protein
MVLERKPGARSSVELLAFAFGDTIIDVAQVDVDMPAYRIGEGKAVRVPVSGDGLPDPAEFALVWAGAGGFWLAFTPSMRGVVLDHRGGLRPLAELVAEGRAIAVDGAHHMLLEQGETIWIEHQSVRFRVRLVAREVVRASTWTLDRSYVASLCASAVVVLAFLMLARAQPAPIVEEDEHHAVLARLLELEPVPPEPIPGPPIETTRRPEPGVEDRAVATTPLPRTPDPRPRSSKREQPRWAPASPAQAVGRFGRSYDPVDAARHAGIFGVLGDRRFLGERVFDPEIDDAQLWAVTADVGPTWLSSFGYRTGPEPGAVGLIGTGSYGSLERMTGEGVIGLGSYGSFHRVHEWRERTEANRELAAFCRGDCRQPVGPRPTIVRVGQVDVQGALDRDIARRIARAHITELRRCFDTTISERTAEFEGNVEFSLIQGKVRTLVTDPAFPDDLADCMKRSIKRWQFPPGSNQATDLVTVSLHLSR